MKKLLLSLVASIMLMSCDIAYDTAYTVGSEVLDEYYGYQFKDVELYYHSDFENLHTIDDINRYIKSHITYKEDKGYQDAKTTLETGLANCTSYSILFANILYYVTGQKANIIIVDGYSSSREVVNGGFDGNHAIIELEDGTQIEPQSGRAKNYEVLYRYGFDFVF